jgi:16S rRNA (guanine(527)-N(7))-methyltransferase RsmG
MAGTEEAHRRALARLAAEWQVGCDDAAAEALLAYGNLLLTWTARINLTAAGSIDALIAEHFPDAFALASRLTEPARLADVGSGGGLPALPLAVLRPTLSLELVEPIAKKGAFLRTAIRELGLSGRVRLNAMRGEALVETAGASFDAAISRATFAPADWLALGQRLVHPGGRVFALAAVNAVPPGSRAQVYFGGRRALVELIVPSGSPADVPRGTSGQTSAAPGEADVPRGTSRPRRRGV